MSCKGCPFARIGHEDPWVVYYEGYNYKHRNGPQNFPGLNLITVSSQMNDRKSQDQKVWIVFHIK